MRGLLVVSPGHWASRASSRLGSPATVAALAGSLALAAIFGALPSYAVRIWMQDGQPWVRGSLLTAVLWLAALAAHLGYDYLVGQDRSMAQLGTATLLLYLVAGLGVQRLVVAYRAKGLDRSGLRAPVAGRSPLQEQPRACARPRRNAHHVPSVVN